MHFLMPCVTPSRKAIMDRKFEFDADMDNDHQHVDPIYSQ